VKFKSALVTQGSGSVGGLTLSHNKGGMYFRSRALPTNPGTVYQTAVRAIMAQLTALWANTLTSAQRAAWSDYALNTPIINKLGEAKPIPGLAMYVRCNVPRIQAGLTRVDDGPTTFGLPDLTPPGITSITAATGVMVVTFEPTDAWAAAADGGLLILTSRGQGPGINYFKGPYRYAGKIEGATTPPTSPQNINVAFTVAAGQQVFVQMRVTTADGRLSYALSRVKSAV
jgi:hypothetical protein